MRATPAVVTLRVVGSALALVLVLGGAASIIADFFRQQTSLTSTVTDAVTRLEIAIGTGDVAVRRAAPGESLTVARRLTWQVGRPTSDVTTSAGVTRVTGGCPGGAWFTSCSVDVEVRLPAGVALQITDTTGDVTIADVADPVHATTTTGDIHLVGVTSQDVVLETSTGDVDAAFAAAPRSLAVRTSVGNAVLRVPSDQTYQVSGTSRVGDRRISVPVDPASAHLIAVSSSVGDVMVLPGS